MITGLNMDEQLLFDYYMKYIHKPNPYGTPPLAMFDSWRKETYGKNKMEQFWEYVGASRENPYDHAWAIIIPFQTKSSFFFMALCLS